MVLWFSSLLFSLSLNGAASFDQLCNRLTSEWQLLSRSVIYRARVTDEDSNVETYTGLTSRHFKDRFYEHRTSFNRRDDPSTSSAKSTTLSSHIWNLKDRGKNYDIIWHIIGKARAFNPLTKKCNLCLFIIFQPEGASLNLRSELFSTCRHRKNNLLENLWSS